MARRDFHIDAAFAVGLWTTGVHQPYEVIADPLPADVQIMDVRLVKNGPATEILLVLCSDEWTNDMPREITPTLRSATLLNPDGG